MKHSSGAEGFTIVETLIVLAVTGSMLLMAMVLIGGRQNKAQFEQGVRSFQMDLQQVINDVGTGYYASNDDIRCTYNAVTGVVIAAASQERGTNDPCIFLGKAIQFDVDGTTDPEQFNVYTIAALRSASTGAVLDLDQARPALIANSGTNGFPDRFDKKLMPFGMQVVSLSYNNNGSPYVPANNPLTAVAFVSSLSSLDSTDKNQRVDVLAVPAANAATSLGRTQQQAVTTTNASLNEVTMSAANRRNPTGGVQICVRSGSTRNQSALYKIGGDGGQTTVSVNIKSSNDCT